MKRRDRLSQRPPDLDELWAQYRLDPSLVNRNALVEASFHIAEYALRRHPHRSTALLTAEDLQQVAVEGLIKAVATWRPDVNPNFEWWAQTKVTSALQTATRRQDRLTRTVRERARSIDNAEAWLRQALRRDPSSQELADHLRITVATLRKWEQDIVLQSVEAMDTLGELDPVSQGLGTEELVTGREARARLLAALATLSPEDRDIILAVQVEERTFESIGNERGVSRHRARNLYLNAFNRLQVSFRAS